jgi:RNA polymerase sigma-70 factor (ECF subfamily)
MSGGGLAAVFEENHAALLRFLRARGAGDAGEDLLQEVWIKAATAATGPIADPLAYLFRTANNLLLDRRRSEVRSIHRESDWAQSANDEPEPSPERALITRGELEAADAALRALGERTDHVFRRYRVDGASQRQIADELGISLSAVEKHLQKAYRAMIELRRRLDAG